MSRPETAASGPAEAIGRPPVSAYWYCTDCGHTTKLDGNIMKRCICGRYMSVRDDGGR